MSLFFDKILKINDDHELADTDSAVVSDGLNLFFILKRTFFREFLS